jgi:signal transduction histidine kinase
MRASHRTRLTLTASGSVAIVLAIVFFGVWAFLRQSELNSARAYLDAGLFAAVADLKAGKQVDRQLWTKNHSRATIDIFDNGKPPSEYKISEGLHGYGLAERKGRQIVYRSADVKGQTVVDFLDWTEWTSSLRQLSLALIVLYPILVGIVALVTWQSAKATFQPLQEMSYQAASIGGSDFTARIDVEDAAEFGLFAAQLNALLARIEDAVRAQEQFAADAAHELRTPLTVMRGKIETALLTSRTPEEYSKTLRALLKEVDRLTRLSEALLESARPERSNAPLLNVEPAVWEVASRWLDRYVTKRVRLEVNSGPANVNIRREEIACVLDNLLANALRYSPPGSCCEVTLQESDGGVLLVVQDEGTGIKGGGIQAFERFWREDGARSRGSGGFGIGLSVCKRLVESRNGKISVDTTYAKGARICINFPTPNKPANLSQPAEVSLRNM